MRINSISNQAFGSKYLYLTAKRSDIDTLYNNLCDEYQVNKNKEKKTPDKAMIYKDKTDCSILVLTGYDALEFEKNKAACDKSGYDSHLHLYDICAQDAMRIDLTKQVRTR